jgi:AraC-like DNA-binding protein
MFIFNYTPTPETHNFDGFYERCAREGMVHSAVMCGEHFDMAEVYDDAWAYPAVTWSCGGVETYRLAGKRALSVQPAGVLTIAAGERYAYDASPGAPFRSNMIAFPRWMRDGATAPGDSAELSMDAPHLITRLCRPAPQTLSLMAEIAAYCVAGVRNYALYTEQIVLLYARLLKEQRENQSGAVTAVKKSTRRELARRIELSAQYILEGYRNPALSTSDIADAACLSRFHLIRTFKDFKGRTPMQYLTATRMEAALQLLHNSEMTIGRIAHAVGYSDRTAFVRAFNRLHGVAPSVVRQRGSHPNKAVSSLR